MELGRKEEVWGFCFATLVLYKQGKLLNPWGVVSTGATENWEDMSKKVLILDTFSASQCSVLCLFVITSCAFDTSLLILLSPRQSVLSEATLA